MTGLQLAEGGKRGDPARTFARTMTDQHEG